MRSALVVIEMALALVLLIGASLLTRSFRDLLNTSGGFEPEDAVAGYVSLPTSQYPDATRERSFYAALQDRLRALPGVTFSGIGTTLPLSGRRSERVFTPSDYEQPVGARLNLAGMTVVNSEYLQAIGATLVRGRYFTPQDHATAERVAIVTQSFARQYWAGKDPIGKRLMWGVPKAPRPWLTVVGVVGDVQLNSLDSPAGLHIYVPADQVESSTSPASAIDQLRAMYVVVRGRSGADALAAGLRGAVRQVDERLAVATLRPLADTMSASVAPQRFSMLLMAAFAGGALVLAVIGIHGVVAYSVAQRTREIGIRVALGADAAGVVAMILRGGIRIALLGVVIGTAAAVACAPMLEALLFGIAPLDVPTFVSVALLLLFVAIVATYIPARRATRVDPVVALRSE
jgi:predicted permease